MESLLAEGDLMVVFLLLGAVTVLNRKKIERLSVFSRKLERSAESVREGVQILLQVVKYLLLAKGKVNTDNFIVFTSQNSPCAAYLPTEVPFHYITQKRLIY